TGHPACVGTAPGSTCGITCTGDADLQCHYPSWTTPCSSNACKGVIETHGSTCNGAGLCQDGPVDCGAYVCGATVCKTSCAANTDCVDGYFCNKSVCEARHTLGVACTDASGCEKGLFCTDGFCCGVSSCGAGSTCGGSVKGSCRKLAGQACSTTS